MKLLRFRIDAPVPGVADSQSDTDAAGKQDASDKSAPAAENYWCRKFGDPELDEIVEEHHAWVESGGESGKKAELASANFEGADLMGADLRGANLLRANLRGADLLLADLRGACLIEADLREANLVSTNFHGASLAGANLATATGLVARQLGGASLIGAELPETLLPFEGLEANSRVCRMLRVLLGVMLAVCACLWGVIGFTTDAALVKNAPAPIPLAGHAIPMLSFYLAAPMIVAAVYIAFHFHLQKLWDGMEELPAVFPDGRRIAEFAGATMIALAPRALREPESEKKRFARARRMMAHTFAYWMVPATLLLAWARYLPEQDWRGSLLQIFFLLAAAAMSGFLPRAENGIFAPTAKIGQRKKRIWESWHMGRFMTLTAAGCALLVVFTLGTMLGAPRQLSRAPHLAAGDFRRWPAYVFGVAGYDPFPNLAGARISDAPAGWSGKIADLGAVKGARLGSASLRYAEADGAFFANAEMEGGDFSGGDFAQADFRGANLARANVSSADLSRADFRDADLRYADLAGLVATDARFGGANFYNAILTGARMDRVSMAKSDLRQADLENAEMNEADFRGAYLGGVKFDRARLAGAKFGGAFMDGAQLEQADLRDASFSGAILNGAQLAGADLDGADLRGVLGLTAEQICLAKSHAGAQMDSRLQSQTDARCGEAP